MIEKVAEKKEKENNEIGVKEILEAVYKVQKSRLYFDENEFPDLFDYCSEDKGKSEEDSLEYYQSGDDSDSESENEMIDEKKIEKIENNVEKFEKNYFPRLHDSTSFKLENLVSNLMTNEEKKNLKIFTENCQKNTKLDIYDYDDRFNSFNSIHSSLVKDFDKQVSQQFVDPPEINYAHSYDEYEDKVDFSDEYFRPDLDDEDENPSFHFVSDSLVNDPQRSVSIKNAISHCIDVNLNEKDCFDAYNEKYDVIRKSYRDTFSYDNKFSFDSNESFLNFIEISTEKNNAENIFFSNLNFTENTCFDKLISFLKENSKDLKLLSFSECHFPILNFDSFAFHSLDYFCLKNSPYSQKFFVNLFKNQKCQLKTLILSDNQYNNEG